jgi:hypothetical protein
MTAFPWQHSGQKTTSVSRSLQDKYLKVKECVPSIVGNALQEKVVCRFKIVNLKPPPRNLIGLCRRGSGNGKQWQFSEIIPPFGFPLVRSSFLPSLLPFVCQTPPPQQRDSGFSGKGKRI